MMMQLIDWVQDKKPSCCMLYEYSLELNPELLVCVAPSVLCCDVCVWIILCLTDRLKNL